MVGDPCQLPATVFSRAAKDLGYGQSLFQRLNQAGYPMLMLETQYRMHRDIAEFPSLRFYNGRLRTDEKQSSGSHDKPYHHDPSGRFRPFVLHDVRHGRERLEGMSVSNADEVQYVVSLFADLQRLHAGHKAKIGIIAPYRAQRRALKNAFRQRWGANCDVEISTVDGFQGREKDIVIFSCVRAPRRDPEPGPVPAHTHTHTHSHRRRCRRGPTSWRSLGHARAPTAAILLLLLLLFQHSCFEC